MLKMLAVSVPLALLLPAVALAQQHGQIDRMQGDVRIVRGGQTLAAKNGHDVRPNDRIVVGSNGAAGVTTPDNAKLALGPNSQMLVEQIDFNKHAQDGNLAVRILKGTFTMLSGALSKIAPQKTRVQAPTATIGIRGTEFSVRVDVPAEAEAAALSGKPLDAAQGKGVGVVVGLDQGSVEVKGNTGKLAHYREFAKKEADDFAAYKQNIQDGVDKEKQSFEAYKANIQREFVGYVESVTLKPGAEISLNGETAVEREGVSTNESRDFMQRWKAGR